MNERTIFLEALEKDNPEQRSAFLDEVCGEDAELRQRVETLLSAHNDAGSFLEKTPQEIDADSVFGETAGRTPDLAEGSATDNSTSDEAWQNLLTPTDAVGRLGNLGPYEICELVGRGGMGVVLRAHEPKLSRTVAVKLLAPELALNPIAVQRFLREARAAAAVSHDHVVAIHSIDDESHPPLIVMEFIQGQSLQQKIDTVGALDVRSILRIGMQTAAGLSAAHRQGLVHRDIKPANILLENGIERVKLTDFGLARAVDDISMTRTGQITGTPQYMSPEQAQGLRVDHRTDLFSLGCVLYAMCTGRAAFRADSAVAVMHRVVHEVPRPIREVNEDIPEWLSGIVEKLLAKDADDRFDSAEEVEDLLSRHLAHLQQPTVIPQPAPVVFPGGSVEDDTVVSSQPPPVLEAAIPRGNVPSWLLWKIPAWSPFVLVVWLAGLRLMTRFGPSQYAEVAETATILTILVAMPVAVAMIIRKLSNDRRDKKSGSSRLESHSGFWFVLFAAAPVVAGLAMKPLAGDGPAGLVGAMMVAMLAALFLLKKRRDMGQDPPSPNSTPRQSGVSSESGMAVPQWLLRPFPGWLALIVFSTLCGIQMLNDYGPDLPLRLALLPATYIFQFAVAPPLIVAMFLSKWLRARAGVAVEQNDESRDRTGVLAVSLAVAMVVTLLACDAMGIEKRIGPLLIGTTIGSAIGLAVSSRRARRRTQAAVDASDISHDAEPEHADGDRLSRFVDIPEELERDLRGVGLILTLVYMAVMIAPFGTYIIADQVRIPFVGWIIGFFGLAAVLVFPIMMRAAMDLNWLPMSRRRPGPAMLMATSLAVVPWNPLLLLLLPWTIPAFRRVRRPDILNLIGVTEDDLRRNHIFGIELDLVRNRTFLIMFAMVVITITLENNRITHIASRARGLFEGTGIVSFEGLKPGGSILGPSNAAETGDPVDGGFEATLPVGDYEIVSVGSNSFIQRIPLTVGAGMWREHQVADWAEGMIIRGPDRKVRNAGLFRVTTRADVTCDAGQVYLPVKGQWLVFAPPGEYQVTTTLRDGSGARTLSTIPTGARVRTAIVGLIRTGSDVAKVKITKAVPSNG
ncbi:MAG: serine/threonine-protein kinase [Planctomycetota bacterium]|nr:serine/threonine-protein kinase [Planctomycetota bacterium]